MTTIRNTCSAPLRIHLPGGKVLHLNPGRTARLPHGSEDLPSIRAMLQTRRIALVSDVDRHGSAGDRPGGEEVSVHGHPQPHRALVAGNR